MALENIETLDLVVFDAVREAGSMSQAAQALLLAPPSVSARVAGLERKLGARLFERTARGVTPTPAGVAFSGYVSRCLELLQESHRAIAEPKRRRVTIATPASVGAYLLSRVLEIADSLSLDTHCKIAHSLEVLEGVVGRTIDAGFVINRPTPGTVVKHPVGTARIFAVTRPSHPLLEGDGPTLDDVAAYGSVVYRWSSDAAGLAQALELGRASTPRPVHLVGLPSIAVEMAIRTNYVAVVPEFAVARELNAGELRMLPLDLPRHVLDLDLVLRREDAEAEWAHELARAIPETFRQHCLYRGTPDGARGAQARSAEAP